MWLDNKKLFDLIHLSTWTINIVIILQALTLKIRDHRKKNEGWKTAR